MRDLNENIKEENTTKQTSFDKLKAFVKKNKGKVIGGAAVLGTAATLALGSIAGQHDIPGLNPGVDTGFDTEPFPDITLRTPEEIEETGVTAQDIKDLLSKYVLDAFKYSNYNHKDDAGASWDTLSAQGLKISTYFFNEKGSDGKMTSKYYPFYYCEDEYYLDHKWFQNGQLFEMDTRNPLRGNVYPISLSGIVVIDGKGFYRDHNEFAISESDFLLLARVFNLKSFPASDNQANEYSYIDEGQIIYESKEFNINDLDTYTQEQLDALYYVLNNSFYSINFQGKLPTNSNSYEMGN